MTERTRPGDAAVQRARLAIAEEFRAAAGRTIEGHEATAVGHAAVTLFVHAGIAAADAICCSRRASYSVSENHLDAVRVLVRADRASGPHLETLLRLKSRAGYSTDRMSEGDLKRAQRAADALLVLARQLA